MGQPNTTLYVVLAVVIVGVRLLALLFPRGSGARRAMQVAGMLVSAACIVYLYWVNGRLR
jgi:hypothetical protein